MRRASLSPARRNASTSSAPSRANTRQRLGEGLGVGAEQLLARAGRQVRRAAPRRSPASSSRNAFDSATSLSIRRRSSATGSAEAAPSARMLVAADLDLVEPGPAEVGPDPARLLLEEIGVAAQPPGRAASRPVSDQARDEVLARGRPALGLERALRSASAPRASPRRRKDRRARAGTRRRLSAAPRPRPRGCRRS